MRTTLNIVRSKAEQLAANRQCGPCTACCVLPRIHVDADFPEGKLGYTPCQHLCTTGCSVHDTRPQLCRDWDCLWKAGLIEGDDRRRPDNLGLMFTLDQHRTGRFIVEAWELWPGAARDHPGRNVLDRMSEKYGVQIRFYGCPFTIDYFGPDRLELGAELSRLAREDPKTLARWCEQNVFLGRLETVEEMSAVLADLESLREGKAIQPYYRRK